ncbi:MAG: hypothetical protein AAGA56_08150 [Myxococcota bacterium]
MVRCRLESVVLVAVLLILPRGLSAAEEEPSGDDAAEEASVEGVDEEPTPAEDVSGADDEEVDMDNKGGDTADKDDDGAVFPLLDFMTFSVGILGNVGASFLDEPGDQTVQGREFLNNSGYPGFVGLTTGVGPSFEVRFFGWVGIELDVLFQTDRGTADLDSTIRDSNGNIISRSETTIEIGQSAVHLPLLIKGAIPGKWVTPVVFIGPEFVIGRNATCEECDSPPNTQYAAVSASYTALAFGFGMEINLPVPNVDLRIPITLRGNFNPSVSDRREERATHVVTNDNIDREEVAVEWKYQASGAFGLAWHF